MRVKPGTAATTTSIAKEIVAESGMLRSSSLWIYGQFEFQRTTSLFSDSIQGSAREWSLGCVKAKATSNASLRPSRHLRSLRGSGAPRAQGGSGVRHHDLQLRVMQEVLHAEKQRERRGGEGAVLTSDAVMDIMHGPWSHWTLDKGVANRATVKNSA